MNILGKVRRLYHRDRLSLSEIERRTGLTRKTIRNWLKAPEGTEPKYRRQIGESKIAPYVERLLKMLEVDARRPKRDRRTALKLYAELQNLGFDGNYSRVTEFIRRWRENGGAAVVKAFVPLQFEPGEAHQFDWSEEHIVIGGVWRQILLAHLKPCFSRAFVVQAYPTQSHEMLFDAHTRAFTALGAASPRSRCGSRCSNSRSQNERLKMAEANRKIGCIDCPVCGETLPVRQNGRDTLNISCPWCGVSSYAKGGSEAHGIITGWLQPNQDQQPAVAAEPVPVPVPAKATAKQPASMPWEL